MRSQFTRARCERRLSHLRQIRTTSERKRWSASKFPVIPKYPKCPLSFCARRCRCIRTSSCRCVRQKAATFLNALRKRSFAVERFTIHFPARDLPQKWVKPRKSKVSRRRGDGRDDGTRPTGSCRGRGQEPTEKQLDRMRRRAVPLRSRADRRLG